MRILLGSGGNRTQERQALWRSEAATLYGSVARVLFIPWAIVDHDGYEQKMNDLFEGTGITFESIHHADDPVEAVRSADGVYVGGGNTFLLARSLHHFGVIEAIRTRVLKEGLPYMGVSAGSNVACPTMQTTNDMPVVFPGSFETLSLVPFQVNAHYYPGAIWSKDEATFTEHFGETRQDRIAEFHQHNSRPVVGLREGAFLRCDETSVVLRGGRATVFFQGLPPVEQDAEADLSSLLAT
ncbi:MAG: dipeptidase PepE [Phycisphaerales bacterium]|nr:dipeptidase PepE [Phycisphaerales bacterium]